MKNITKPDNQPGIIIWSYADGNVGNDLCDKLKSHYIKLAKSADAVNVITLRRLERDIKTNLNIYGRVDADKITIAQDGPSKYRLMQYGVFTKDGSKICSAPYSEIDKLPVWEKLTKESRCLVYVNRYVDYDSQGLPHEFYLPNYERFVIPSVYQISRGYLIKRFIILTHESSDSINHITKQMPYILPEDKAIEWLKYGEKAFDYTIINAEHMLTNVHKKK